VAPVEFVSQQTLDRISSEAKHSPRLRRNYNFHASDGEICHRLLNALEPDSYIQPHRHLDIHKDETLAIIRGRMGMVVFDSEGVVTQKALLEPNGDLMLVNLPHGTFHTLVSLAERSVFFEAKAGPFVPLRPEEKAPWAPPEGDAASAPYLASLKALFRSHP